MFMAAKFESVDPREKMPEPGTGIDLSDETTDDAGEMAEDETDGSGEDLENDQEDKM